MIYIKYKVLDGFVLDEVESILEAEEEMKKMVKNKKLSLNNGEILVCERLTSAFAKS